MLDRVLHESVEKPARVGFLCVAANMFQPPRKRQRSPVGLLGPAHVFIPPDLLFEQIHRIQTIEYSVEAHANQIAPERDIDSVRNCSVVIRIRIEGIGKQGVHVSLGGSDKMADQLEWLTLAIINLMNFFVIE